MTRLLAIDPGRRTGVAILEFDDKTAPTLIDAVEVYNGVDGFRQWWQMYSPKYDILVAESFKHREGVKGVDHSALEVLGWLSGLEPTLQPPAGRKRAVPDAALKRLGLYLPGEKNRNAREAVRHGVWWLKNQGHKPTIRRAFVSIDW